MSKDTNKKSSAGRPKSAVANNPQSILDKANWELCKFDAKVANNMGKILDAYYKMAFSPALKENTRLTVLKDLIKMQKENIAAMEEVEDMEKDTTNSQDSDEDEDDFELSSILSVEFNESGN